jgi:NADH-quinone oxidoreductase subunit N
MSLLPFVVVTLAAGALSLLTRRDPRLSAAIAAAGLLAALVAASTIRDELSLFVGGVELAGSEGARTFLVLGTLTSGLLAIVAAATGWSRELPGAALLMLAAIGVTAGATDPTVALLAAGLSAVPAAVPLAATVGERAHRVAATEMRALTVATALGIVAVAVVAGPLGAATGEVGADPRVTRPVLGLAVVAVAVATAVRLGVIPFHLRVARIADVAPVPALALTLAWSPAVFAGVAIGWTDVWVRGPGVTFPVEQAVIVLAAAAAIVFGTAAALLHDDLEHVVAYSVVADAGLLLLAFAALDLSAAPAAATWLLAFVVGKSALAGWAAAVRGRLGRGRLSELAGWAREAPALGIALALIAIAQLGWPGAAVFTARRDLTEAAVGGIPGVLLLVASMAAVVVHGRLLAVGLVVAAPRARPPAERRSPAASPRRDRVRDGLFDAAVAGWDRHRSAAAAASVIGLAALALAVASGLVAA